jgi:acetyl esterase
MPLDPKAQALLDQLAAAGIQPTHTMTPAEARVMMTRRRELNPPPSDAVASVEDRAIPGPAGEIPLRVYSPLSAQPTYGVVTYFHGGGWVIGDLESHDAVCRALSNATESVVVSVDYRLAPEHRYPAAADDAYAATVWVAQHAADLGADSTRLAVAGDSAGGNLAAAVSMMARDRGGPSIAHQALIYPVVDATFDTPSYVENGTGYSLGMADMQWFWDQYAHPDVRSEPYAAPLRAAHFGDLPPALVLTAEYDPLRDEGEVFAARLREAQVEVTLTRYAGMMHGFIGMLGIFEQSRAAVAEIGTAVRTAFAVDRTPSAVR